MDKTFHVTPFQFTGKGREYFAIWIVDLVLTVLTLGLYSAWAKVHRKRYFYRHTRLAGRGFDYLGKPANILHERLPGFVLLLGALVAYLLDFPWLAAALLGTLVLLIPLQIQRSLRFDAWNSGYRGLRFNFLGSADEAYRIYLGGFLFTVLTLGLALPTLYHLRSNYVIGHRAYGSSRFTFKVSPGAYYSIFMKSSLVLLAPVVALLAGGITLASLLHSEPVVGMTDILASLGFGLSLLYAALPVAAGYINERVARLNFLATRCAGYGFAGRHTARGLIRLYLSNMIGIVLTLGLFIPWARVRAARYWLDNLAVVGPQAGLDGFISASSSDPATQINPADMPPEEDGEAGQAPTESISGAFPCPEAHPA